MFFFSSTRRCIARIASLVILFAALAPTVSHALVANGLVRQGWMEICSGRGLQLIKVDVKMDVAKTALVTPSSANGSAPQIAFEHCPFCLPHGGNLGLPPTSFALPSPLVAAFSHPPLFYQSPQPLFAWSNSRSRAPPQLA